MQHDHVATARLSAPNICVICKFGSCKLIIRLCSTSCFIHKSQDSISVGQQIFKSRRLEKVTPICYQIKVKCSLHSMQTNAGWTYYCWKIVYLHKSIKTFNIKKINNNIHRLEADLVVIDDNHLSFNSVNFSVSQS